MISALNNLEKYLIILIGIALSTSCSNNKGDNINKNNLFYTTKKISAIGPQTFESSRFVENIQYVLLENTQESIFTNIDKIKVDHGKIYIMDVSGTDQVFIFNDNGQFLRKIGKKGHGPGEYLMLCDFDVDKNGKLYLYDRQHKQMLTYDSLGNFVISKETPFRADGFALLNDGKYIFSMAKESPHEIILNSKLVITDSAFNVIDKFFSYDENFKDNYANPRLFQETPIGIYYNKPVNDSIFLINRKGKIVKSYFMDFGKQAVPKELKYDAFKLAEVEQEESFKYMYTPPVLLENLLTGTIHSSNKRVFFLYHLKEDKMFVKS